MAKKSTVHKIISSVIPALFLINAQAWGRSPAADQILHQELDDLYAKYRCPIEDRLQRLYEAGDPAQDGDRFIAVTLIEHKHAYVQCRFHDNERKVLCEAASGFYYDLPGTLRTMYLPAHAIAALGQLGFSTDDSAGNYQADFDVLSPPDFTNLAELILKALHDGYGARAEMALEFEAPFAPGLVVACDPIA